MTKYTSDVSRKLSNGFHVKNHLGDQEEIYLLYQKTQRTTSLKNSMGGMVSSRLMAEANMNATSSSTSGSPLIRLAKLVIKGQQEPDLFCFECIVNNDEVEKKWTTKYRNDVVTYILDNVEPLGAEIIYDGDINLVSSTWKKLDKSKEVY